MSFEFWLFFISLLIFISVISSKVLDRFAVPVLLVFLGIGILAGSEGIGRIYFDNAVFAKSLGTVALIFIIFSGGLDTDWKETKPVILPGIILSTLGVLITAVVTGFFAVYILNFSLLEGMLLGSIVSSTDAAAVFTTLRSKNISLKKPLKPLLEFESGSNDPMAVFLTVGVISLITVQGTKFISLVPSFIIDMGMGLAVGYVMAKFSLFLIKRLNLEYEGLYPVIMISLVLLTFTIAGFVKGNGFLAVYVAGLMLGKVEFQNKRMIKKFHDGIAWLMQIVMFVTLGLLVFPSQMLPYIWKGLLITVLLMVVARPAGVLISLLPFKMKFAKKLMISWVGLRGSVPIILATFPLTAGIDQANVIFNIVFFVVAISVFIQGTSIPIVSKLLGLDAPMNKKINYPIQFEKMDGMDAELTDVPVPYESPAVGKTIAELGVPKKLLIVLISRQGQFIVPSGSTVIEQADILLVLSNNEDILALQKLISTQKV